MARAVTEAAGPRQGDAIASLAFSSKVNLSSADPERQALLRQAVRQAVSTLGATAPAEVTAVACDFLTDSKFLRIRNRNFIAHHVFFFLTKAQPSGLYLFR